MKKTAVFLAAATVVLAAAGVSCRKAAESVRVGVIDEITGDMKFQDGSGDPIKSAVILQVKGGKFVYVTNALP